MFNNTTMSEKFFVLLLLIFITISGCGTNNNNASNTNISSNIAYKQTDVFTLIDTASNSFGDYIVSSGSSNSKNIAIYNNKMELISSYSFVSLYSIKKFAINDNGEAVCVYVDEESNNYILKLIYYSPKSGWSSPQIISTSTNFFFDVDASITSDGTVVLAWVDVNSIYSASYAALNGLSPSTIISTIIPGNLIIFGGMAVADNGNAIVVWSELDSNWNTNCYKSVFTQSLGWSSPDSFQNNRNNIKLSKMDSNGNFVMFLRNSSGNNFVARMGINSPYVEKATSPGEYFNSVCLSMNSSGSAFITWERDVVGDSGNIWGVTYSPSIGWSDDKLIIQNAGFATLKQRNSGIDQIGNMFLAYIKSTNNIPALYMAKYSADQGLSKPTMFSTNFYQIPGLDLVVSQMGYVFLSWTQQNDKNSSEFITYTSYFR